MQNFFGEEKAEKKESELKLFYIRLKFFWRNFYKERSKNYIFKFKFETLMKLYDFLLKMYTL